MRSTERRLASVAVRHFGHLAAADRKRLFHSAPEPISRAADLSPLSVALGASLYMPAVRPRLASDLATATARGVVSTIVCLEDAVPDAEVPAAEVNLVTQLRQHGATGAPGTLVFVRVRAPEQIPRLVSGLGEHAQVLSGFVLPKFTAHTGQSFLEVLAETADSRGLPLLAMPVLESPEVIYRETRGAALAGIAALLHRYRERVLAVRIGATDLSGLYALRRSRGLTVYDVAVVADVIADVVNILGRADGSGFTITGPVWEHFGSAERLFKPQLRESPFVEHGERPLRAELLARDLDGLIREVVLDQANGLVGKSVIHPSHASAVHALSVVTHEELTDATDVLDASMAGGGVRASGYANKMNESKPHRAWAEQVLLRASAFGVARAEVSFVDLLGASAG